MASATADPAIATCRRRARAPSTSALLEKGDELQITLMVIGVDYREESDLLRLEGVSLNLLD